MKHDGHAWYKVKTTNVKNDFNLNFQRACCLGHLQCQNDGCDLYFFNKCRNKIVWSGDVVHEFQIVLHPICIFVKFVILPPSM